MKNVFRIIAMTGAIAAFQIVGGRGSGSRLTQAPGHEVDGEPTGDIYVASLTCNGFNWSPMPNWPEKP